MIQRLLKVLTLVFTCFCVGTVIALAIMGSYAAARWRLDREKLHRMLAIAQGLETAATPQVQPAQPQPSPEQVSYDQILEARAVRFRNLELREQALAKALEQLRYEQIRLAEQSATLAKSRAAFSAELAAVQKQVTDAGWEQNRASLVALKPKQAKLLLQEMLARNEIEDVVALLGPMPDAKRAKIIAEFKTAEEMQKIDEVLRLIRRGEPLTAAAAGAQRQLSSEAVGNAEGVNR